jgi:hypothetical protein
MPTGYGLNYRGLISGREMEYSLLHSVQTGSGAQPASWIPAALSLEVKLSERETDHSLPYSAEVKNGGNVSPLLLWSSSGGA